MKPLDLKASDKHSEAGVLGSKFLKFKMPAMVFLAAFLLGLLIAFSRSSIGTATIYDSGLYINSASQLLKAAQVVLSDPGQLEAQCKMLSDTIMLNGPVMPLLGCFAYLMTGSSPSVFQVEPVLFLMVLFNAVTATLIYFISKQLTEKEIFALGGAFLWILYPSALLSTTRFLTEPVSCAVEIIFLMVIIYTLNNKKSSSSLISGLAIGALLATIILLRPAITPAFLLLCFVPLLSLVRKSKKYFACHIAGLLCGFVLLFAPWLAFSKMAYGNYLNIPSRQPVFNLYVGFCLELDGEDYVKEPEELENISKEEAINRVTDKVIKDPIAYITLTQRKLIRLFLYPWNDFRIDLLGINSQLQSWWHVLLVFAAGLGILAWAANLKDEKKSLDNPKIIIPSMCLVFILAHLIYLLFGTTTRYGFTAMPFLVIFATYFLYQFNSITGSKSLLWKLPLATTLTALFLPYDLQGVLYSAGLNSTLSIATTTLLKSTLLAVLFFYLLKPVIPAKRLYACLGIILIAVSSTVVAREGFIAHDYKVTISSGEKFERQVILKTDKPNWAALLVDSNKALEDSTIHLNDNLLGAPLPLYRFSMEESPMSGYQMTAALMKVEIDKLRQWRLIPFPVSYLNPEGKNTISIKSGNSKLSIYGSIPDSKGNFSIPSLSGFRIKKLITNQRELDGRVPNIDLQAGVQSAKIIKGNSQEESLNGLLRTLLVLGYKSDDNAFKPTQLNCNILDSPLTIEPGQLQFKRTAKPLSIAGAGTLEVNVTGQYEVAERSRLECNLVLRRTNRPDSSVSLFNTAQTIELTPGNNGQFQFTNFQPLSGLTETEFFPEISIKAGNQRVTIKSVSCEMTTCDAPDFRLSKYKIY